MTVHLLYILYIWILVYKLQHCGHGVYPVSFVDLWWLVGAVVFASAFILQYLQEGLIEKSAQIKGRWMGSSLARPNAGTECQGQGRGGRALCVLAISQDSKI